MNVYLDIKEDGIKKFGDCCGFVVVVFVCDGGDEVKKVMLFCFFVIIDSSDVGRIDFNEFVGKLVFLCIEEIRVW